MAKRQAEFHELPDKSGVAIIIPNSAMPRRKPKKPKDPERTGFGVLKIPPGCRLVGAYGWSAMATVD